MGSCCKMLKLIVFVISMCVLLGGIIYFVFLNLNRTGCERIKNKASKVFNEMGELIGEFTYYVKK